MQIGDQLIDRVVSGENADVILAEAKTQVQQELGWRGLAVALMSPIGFAQMAVKLYNEHNCTSYALPASADEFIKLGVDLGYLTVLPD